MIRAAAKGARGAALLCGHALGYHSRLLPPLITRLFEAAGFEQIAIRRLIVPQRRYVEGEAETTAGRRGLPRALLARRFRKIAKADLRTAAAHYLFRKR